MVAAIPTIPVGFFDVAVGTKAWRKSTPRETNDPPTPRQRQRVRRRS
jgi:hypothetical protein